MTRRSRWLGRYLIIMAVLGLVDWVIAWALIPGFGPGSGIQSLAAMLINWELPSEPALPVLVGVVALVFLPCAFGNGYPSFCDDLIILVIVFGAVTIFLCLIVNLTWIREAVRDWSQGVPGRWFQSAHLLVYASAVLAAGSSWYCLDVFAPSIRPGDDTLAMTIFLATTHFIHPLFILVTAATGLRLLRRPERA